MNDQIIYELLAKAPAEGLRAVQLCDAINEPSIELADVSRALGALVEVGDVVRMPGLAPNGQQAQFYALTSDFKNSRDYKLILAKQLGQTIKAAAPTPAPTPENTSAPVPSEPKKSRTDDAIEYIRHRGRVSSAELKMHMGLKSGEAPATWLAVPIRDGRLARDGVYWMIGAGAAGNVGKATKPTAARGAIPKLGAVLSSKSPTPPPGAFKVPAETPEPEAAPDTPVPAPEAVAALPVPVAGVFRCGLWSDGVLELQRDGVTLTELTRGEGEHMADFIGRMLKVAA